MHVSGQTSGEVKVGGCDTTTAPESTGSQSNANTVTNDASSGGAPAYGLTVPA